MLVNASGSRLERLYVSLGIITYLDTAKGLKTAYSSFYGQRETQSYVFCDSWYTLLGIFRFYVSLGIITYLDTVKGLKTAYRAFFI